MGPRSFMKPFDPGARQGYLCAPVLERNTRIRLLYCKMRFIHAAKFLQCTYRACCWRVLAFFLRAEISGQLRGHHTLRADRDELAEVSRLRHECRWRNYSGGHSGARLSGISCVDLLVERQDWARCAFLGDDRAGSGGLADMRGRGLLSGDALGFGNREGALVASFPGGLVADGTVPLHRELCGGSAY